MIDYAGIKTNWEKRVKVSPYYQTLYSGLRRNHEHGASSLYPLLYVLRRIVYAMVIVFLIEENMPLFGTLILTISSLMMLAFTAMESPWESSALNYQELVNEFIFYTLCVSLVCFADVLNDTDQALLLGWLMIGLVFVLITFNCVLIISDSLFFSRLLWIRCKNRRKARRVKINKR